MDAKWVFITCIIIFEAGSALCGAAPSEDALIAGRAICGIGGSGMYVGVLTLLSMTTTEKERPKYLGFPGITWGTGTVLGPIIGGAFAESRATWRWGFYINLCVGALFAPVYLLLVPSKDPRPGVDWRSRVMSIDVVGFVLLAGSSTALILAMCFGGLVVDWRSGSMIALWVLAGVLLILFAIQHTFGIGARQVVFPVQMTKIPEFWSFSSMRLVPRRVVFFPYISSRFSK
jgi:MFS family permease